MTPARSDLLAIDRRHLWRPYTSSEDHEALDPLVITRADGPYLYADDGRRYLDGSGAWWCNNLGHGHPRLREALVRQAQDMLHCSMAGTAHPAAVLLAEELVTLAPPGLRSARTPAMAAAASALPSVSTEAPSGSKGSRT